MNKAVPIKMDEKVTKVQDEISVKQALEMSGYRISKYPGKGSLFMPCEVGGCWSCTVEVNKEIKPACVIKVKEGMKIRTELPEGYIPKRIVHGFSGHTVGGVGTPWWLKNKSGYIEVACFAAGCNLSYPQCQNWGTTYSGKGKALTPREAAEIMTATRNKFKVDRMAISGGESTLNRKWLLEYVRNLRVLNPDPNARIHVDTNATILTSEYIDELIEAGMTDIGPDLKGYYPETFMGITGINEERLAERYLQTAWNTVRYLIERHKYKVFIGVGIPYNKKLISIQEIRLIGEKLYQLDHEIQVCVLDYRPEFKRLDLFKPSYDEMVEVHKILKEKGLKTVICQTEYGHVGPEL